MLNLLSQSIDLLISDSNPQNIGISNSRIVNKFLESSVYRITSRYLQILATIKTTAKLANLLFPQLTLKRYQMDH